MNKIDKIGMAVTQLIITVVIVSAIVYATYLLFDFYALEPMGVELLVGMVMMSVAVNRIWCYLLLVKQIYKA